MPRIAHAILLVGTLLIAGCASSDSRIVFAPPKSLAVTSEATDNGGVRLRVVHAWFREAEIIAAQGNSPGEAHGFQVADGSNSDAKYSRPARDLREVPPEAILALLSALGPHSPFQTTGLNESLPDLKLVQGEALVVVTQQPMHEPALFVTIEPASGGPAIDLGHQPPEGYLLDAETLRRIGPDAILRERNLSTWVRLPVTR